MRHNVSTAITTGNAITVAGNNITIDCNDFKIGGLAAGADALRNMRSHGESRLNRAAPG